MDRKLATSLGAVARSARERMRLTQADVAERIDMSAEVYGRLERGTMLPSVETLRRLAQVLNLSADLLLGLRSEGGALRAAEPTVPFGDPPELRRLVRRLRKLGTRQLRILGILADELGRS